VKVRHSPQIAGVAQRIDGAEMGVPFGQVPMLRTMLQVGVRTPMLRDRMESLEP
jgi:hypothetical protein